MNIFKRGLGMVAAGLLLLAAGSAHGDEGMGSGMAMSQGGQTQMDGASCHWDDLKKSLNLSDSQLRRWKAAEKSQHSQAKLLHDQMRADADRLAVLVDKHASDADLKAALDRLETDHQAMRRLKEGRLETLKGILNPRQQAQLVVRWFKTGEHCDRMGHHACKRGKHCTMHDGGGSMDSDADASGD